ncbi:MAG TPA: hypothetical protein VG939_13955 [Caulobacteraceae bacterium]|nr:hypothetical protein [Caulobacteraceae bacterium]
MTAPLKSVVRGGEYRANAAHALAMAEAAGLAEVRARHEHAALAWTGLAEAEEARTAAARLYRDRSPAAAPEPVR